MWFSYCFCFKFQNCFFLRRTVGASHSPKRTSAQNPSTDSPKRTQSIRFGCPYAVGRWSCPYPTTAAARRTTPRSGWCRWSPFKCVVVLVEDGAAAASVVVARPLCKSHPSSTPSPAQIHTDAPGSAPSYLARC